MEGRLRLLRIASRMRLRGYEQFAINLEATAAGDLPTLLPMPMIGEAPYLYTHGLPDGSMAVGVVDDFADGTAILAVVIPADEADR